MRLLVATALILVSFAGCADPDPPAGPPVLEDGPLFDEAGFNFTHPAYSYGVNAMLLESPNGELFTDRADGIRQWYKTPYLGFPGTISGMAQVAQTSNVSTGAGIAVFGGLAFAGSTGSGPMNIINVMDPANPVQIDAVLDVPVRDADTILYPDGRLVIITTAGGSNIFATDVTNPYNGTLIGQLDTPRNNHNIAVVPGTPIVYNTGSAGAIDIIDFTDPENPVVAGEFTNGNRCHDIAFHIDNGAGKLWALCAGYGQTEIWDIADPWAPEMLVEIDYPSLEKGLPIVGEEFDDLGVEQDVACTAPYAAGQPCPVSGAHPSSFSHLAIVNHDATVLIMGDETGGGGSNYCDFYYEGPDGQVMSGPTGNLWFYDITDPTEPDLRGHVSPAEGDAEGSCTAHFGKVIGDTDYLVMAFYTAGITLIDFSDLSNPRILDRLDNGGTVWDVWFHQGWLFTGDLARGVDVISLS